jgi:hypothetical protein
MTPTTPQSTPEIEQFIDAENKNFEISRKALGKTYELIEDFQDVYDSLARSSKLPDPGAAPEQRMVTAAIVVLMGTSRRQFTLGILTLMRAHRADAALPLRRAIESCAFATRIRKHPHLAKVWLDGATGKTEYEKYREKFAKNLFPTDDSLLSDLGRRYDYASKIMHSSIYGAAGHFSFPDGPEGMTLRFFDMPGDHSLITSFYDTVDTHKRILRAFGISLRPNVESNQFDAWEVRLNSVEAKLDVHREEWKKVVPDPRKRQGTSG